MLFLNIVGHVQTVADGREVLPGATVDLSLDQAGDTYNKRLFANGTFAGTDSTTFDIVQAAKVEFNTAPTEPTPPSSSQNDWNDMIEWQINHGKKYLEIPEKVYNNTADRIYVPSGFVLEGRNPETSVVFVKAAVHSAMEQEPHSEVSNIQLHVPVENRVPNPSPGVTPYDGLYGIRTAPKSQTVNVFFRGFHSCFKLEGDHVHISRCRQAESAVFWARLGGGTYETRGNMRTFENDVTGLSFCGHFAGGPGEDNWESYSDHIGWVPFGLFAHDTGGASEFGFPNCKMFSTSLESCGNRQVHLGRRKISGNFYSPATGPLANGRPLGWPAFPEAVPIPDDNWAQHTLQGASGLFGPLAGGIFDQNYVFTSGNVTGRNKEDNDNQFAIIGDGNPPDVYNGPFQTPGALGIFQKLT